MLIEPIRIENAVRWFLARSDIEAAEKIIGVHDLGKGKPLGGYLDYIDKYWHVKKSKRHYNAVYRESGLIEKESFTHRDTFNWVRETTRYRLIEALLSNCGLTEDTRVLDFGCSTGIGLINYHNTFGFTGVGIDIDKTSIGFACELNDKHANSPEKLQFFTGDKITKALHGGFDVAFLFEVLEHVLDPIKLLKDVEAVLNPGAVVILTVPSGPVEYKMWIEHPHRNREHIREYTSQDLLELFIGKEFFYSQHIKTGFEENTKMETGDLILMYRGMEPIGEIDWYRKLSLRVDYQTPLPGL